MPPKNGRRLPAYKPARALVVATPIGKAQEAVYRSTRTQTYPSMARAALVLGMLLLAAVAVAPFSEAKKKASSKEAADAPADAPAADAPADATAEGPSGPAGAPGPAAGIAGLSDDSDDSDDN
ncbi:uncharacterized protein LOC133902227 [Phragmites australis]|uniref:uncharacterized protein LOC133902227 n=1 Tax=Phragmites australis TaxID=29695 RepID=UPI002D76A96B|nr:uncharacterized protein LOC133902227 [Phragmites australis]